MARATFVTPGAGDCDPWGRVPAGTRRRDAVRPTHLPSFSGDSRTAIRSRGIFIGPVCAWKAALRVEFVSRSPCVGAEICSGPAQGRPNGWPLRELCNGVVVMLARAACGRASGRAARRSARRKAWGVSMGSRAADDGVGRWTRRPPGRRSTAGFSRNSIGRIADEAFWRPGSEVCAFKNRAGRGRALRAGRSRDSRVLTIAHQGQRVGDGHVSTSPSAHSQMGGKFDHDQDKPRFQARDGIAKTLR